MQKDNSFGIIPLKKYKQEVKVLLVKHNASHWAFPKGHAEEGETAIEAALRELFEETHLVLREFLQFGPLKESYIFQREGIKYDKTVLYFPAWVKGKLQVDQNELESAQWFSLVEAKTRATFAPTKNMCQTLTDYFM